MKRKKKVVMSVRVFEDTAKKIRDLAEKEHRTPSAMLHLLVEWVTARCVEQGSSVELERCALVAPMASKRTGANPGE